MDFLTQLAGATGLDPNQAKGLAGAVLGTVHGAVAEEEPDAASRMADAIPELDGWKAQASSLLGGGGAAGGLGGLLGGGLAGGLAEMVGGKGARETVQLVAILQRFGLDASKAAVVAPLAYSFLEERLGAELLSKVLSYAPFLTGQGAPAGGIAGALGGLLGGGR